MTAGLKQGTRLQGGKYRIERVLGAGSFGITYLATAKFTTQGNLGTMEVEAKVAIKEFFMSEVNSRRADGSSVEGSSGSVFTNYRKKFRKEAENLSKLSHPNIVKVFDVFDENNTTYYVMDFIEGENLDEYIGRMGKLSESETILIVGEIGNAVSYMHSKKMLHLDIKPKNIMRASDGHLYLIDFGLSKQFTADNRPETTTTIGLGTPGYAPGEQGDYRPDGSFPATLDVYALGATMFKMLTGRRPPLATSVLNDGFPAEELINAGVSKDTRGVVEKAMEPKRKNRYQSIGAFLEHLKSKLKKADGELARKKQDEIDWNQAKKQNTVHSYDAYLSKYPFGTYKKEAKYAIERLEHARFQSQENSDWYKACQLNTLDSYKKFVSKYESKSLKYTSSHLEDAKRKVEELRRSSPVPTPFKWKKWLLIASLIILGWLAYVQYQARAWPFNGIPVEEADSLQWAIDNHDISLLTHYANLDSTRAFYPLAVCLNKQDSVKNLETTLHWLDKIPDSSEKSLYQRILNDIIDEELGNIENRFNQVDPSSSEAEREYLAIYKDYTTHFEKLSRHFPYMVLSFIPIEETAEKFIRDRRNHRELQKGILFEWEDQHKRLNHFKSSIMTNSEIRYKN